MIEKLDESTFLLFAAKNYNNTQCYDVLEFYEDLKRFKYLKRLFNKYESKKDLKERLILNHIIALINVFGPANTAKMLFFKLKGYESYFIPFLILLSALPEKIYGIEMNSDVIYTTDFPLDVNIINALRKI